MNGNHRPDDPLGPWAIIHGSGCRECAARLAKVEVVVMFTDAEMRRVRASIRRLARAMNTIKLPLELYDGPLGGGNQQPRQFRGIRPAIIVGLALHTETGRKIGDMPATVLGVLGEYAETAMEVHEQLDRDSDKDKDGDK